MLHILDLQLVELPGDVSEGLHGNLNLKCSIVTNMLFFNGITNLGSVAYKISLKLFKLNILSQGLTIATYCSPSIYADLGHGGC